MTEYEYAYSVLKVKQKNQDCLQSLTRQKKLAVKTKKCSDKIVTRQQNLINLTKRAGKIDFNLSSESKN